VGGLVVVEVRVPDEQLREQRAEEQRAEEEAQPVVAQASHWPSAPMTSA
jgi:hypothetical protein